MANTYSKNRLVRSDQRLIGLGLFSIALLMGVMSFVFPNVKMLSTPTTTSAERIIKIEERPFDFSNQIRNVDDSFAAEEYMEDEATDSGMMMHPMNNEDY